MRFPSAKALTLVLLGAALAAVSRLVVTALGYVTGWMVGLVFERPLLTFFAQAGFSGLSVAELGAILAFVGSFFYSFSPTQRNG